MSPEGESLAFRGEPFPSLLALDIIMYYYFVPVCDCFISRCEASNNQLKSYTIMRIELLKERPISKPF